MGVKSTAESVSAETEEQLWRRCQTEQDGQARATLIEQYIPFARQLAGRLYKTRIDNDVEFVDYLQYAMLGLVESVDRFQWEKGVVFSAYAKHRIRGAILNGLEKCSEKREQLACLRRQRLERARSMHGDHAPSSTNDIFQETVDIAIGLALGFLLEDSGLVRAPDAKTEDRAPQERAMAQLRVRIDNALEALSEREKLIVRYHYFHQVGFEELADILKITKGRVSQLHKRALSSIRVSLANQVDLDSYF